MKALSIALGALLLVLAVTPSADARYYRPPWVIIRWANGDCRVWYNTTGPWWGYGWRVVGSGRTYYEAWWKMWRLYRLHRCI